MQSSSHGEMTLRSKVLIGVNLHKSCGDSPSLPVAQVYILQNRVTYKCRACTQKQKMYFYTKEVEKKYLLSF